MLKQPRNNADQNDSEWDAQFAARLERNLAVAQTKLVIWKRIALITTSAFFLDCAAVIPFLYGHSLHDHWEAVGKYLVLVAMALLPAFTFSCGIAYSLWKFVRDSQLVQRM
jgi:hypothetical protein